jgi:hypothetical protein
VPKSDRHVTDYLPYVLSTPEYVYVKKQQVDSALQVSAIIYAYYKIPCLALNIVTLSS